MVEGSTPHAIPGASGARRVEEVMGLHPLRVQWRLNLGAGASGRPRSGGPGGRLPQVRSAGAPAGDPKRGGFPLPQRELAFGYARATPANHAKTGASVDRRRGGAQPGAVSVVELRAQLAAHTAVVGVEPATLGDGEEGRLDQAAIEGAERQHREGEEAR